MKPKKDNFSIGASVYLISNIVSALIPFLLLPVLTRYLSPSEYGQVAMFQVMIGFLAAFVGLNANGIVVREYYNNDTHRYQGYFSSALLILVLSFIILSFLSFYFIESISNLMSISIHWVSLAIFTSLCSFLIKMILGQYQVRKKIFKYATIQVSLAGFNVGFSLIFVVLFNFGQDGRVFGIVIANTIIAFLCLVLLIRKKLFSYKSIKTNYVSDTFFYGVNLIPHITGIFLLNTIDRFVISNYLGLEYAGFYMSAVQLSLVFTFFHDAVNKAYVPWLFGKLKSGVDFNLIVCNTYKYIFVLIIFAFLSYKLSPYFIVPILGEEYKSVEKIIGILCFSSCINGIYYMFTNYIIYNKRTKLLSKITLLSGGINVALSIYLVRSFGIQGVAFAFFISTIVRCLLTSYFAIKITNMPWFEITGIKK